MARRSWQEAMHAVQAGIAIKMELGLDNDTTPKHLRVGINAAMCDHAALVRLLIARGVFSEPEYLKAIEDEANREAERYEAELTQLLGKIIKLV